MDDETIQSYLGELLPSLVAQRLRPLPARRETQVQSWVGKIPWRRKWQPTLVFLPGKSHGRRSLVGSSPRGRNESDRLSDFTFFLGELFTQQ